MSRVLNSLKKKKLSSNDIKDIKNILNEEFKIPQENKIYFEYDVNNTNSILRTPTFSNFSQTNNSTAISTPKRQSNKSCYTSPKKRNKEKNYKKSKYTKQDIKKHVKFKTNFVEIFDVECWKKYNENNVYEKKKKKYCKFNIF